MSRAYPCGTPEPDDKGVPDTVSNATPAEQTGADTSLRHTLHDGHQDGLKPLHSLDLAQAGSVDSLVRGMGGTSFGGRSLGQAADVLEAMVTDTSCHVVLTLSGAMTIAKQGLVICEMIERGWVQAIVSTGALMAHGLVESLGMQHFAHDPKVPDATLFERGYNRVYDTIELEKNLDDTERIMAEILSSLDPDQPTSSHEINATLGRWLIENTKGRGPLKSAAQHGVPVYVPAFTDSELGLDFATNNHARRDRGEKPLQFDPFRDLDHFHQKFTAASVHGIFTVGGGVPRNWAQQVAPYIDILGKRVPSMAREPLRYRYAVRLCPEPVHWGGLSGCDYSESVSWGKIVPAAEGGRWAEVKADATIAWPLVVRAVMERLEGSQPSK
ncbi:MAG: deoxyhypusine synthase family protein [Planctomycetota bacterium]|nr:deoxyhypusine synthase family protein [Planctomycetota bacterium]